MNKKRCSLDPQTVNTFVCLRDWCLCRWTCGNVFYCF